MQALTRRSFICGSAAVAALTAMPAVAATGVKTLKNGDTVIDLVANKTLSNVGGLLELSIKTQVATAEALIHKMSPK